MAGSVNKVILVGNLGRDPETRYTQNNQKIVHLNHTGDAARLDHPHRVKHHHVGRTLEDDEISAVRVNGAK